MSTVARVSVHLFHVLVCAGLFLALGLDADASAGVRVVAEHKLPPETRWAADVRWVSDASVAVAHAGDGSFQVPLAAGKPASVLMPAGSRRGPGPVGQERTLIWAHTMLGVSDRFFAFAAPSFELAWVPRQPGGVGASRVVDFLSAVDLDVHENRLLVVGLPSMAPAATGDGPTILWETNLEAPTPPVFRPRFSLSRPVPESELDDWLHASGSASVRFLTDGSFLLVPGIEPGVYWYNSDGRLLRAWNSEALGLDVVGPSDPAGARRAASNRGAMLALRNALRLTDEILPLPEGPAVVVRHAREKDVVWTMSLLRRDGSITSVELPIQVSSPNWTLFGDAQDRRVILVLFETCERGPRTCSPSRLVELEVTP
ncbi:MAG TPA: hypothetical protein P5234_10195 [Thermoanaerobaculaceae bacterium]|nr:hypothetical protein [Thermoanaerobaculaceae bacterium]HRS16598.1 hypothetical protein [Thermoanaerobaculaceae bacterium]